MKRKDEPNIWVTVIKLVLGAVILIGGMGTILWYVDQEQSKNGNPAIKPVDSWGISNDSPIRSKR